MTEPLRLQLRTTLANLAGTTSFTDTQDVFATSVVRSMNLLELICFVEDSYGITISQRDVFEGHLRSVERMVAFVTTRRTELR
ncbi:MAG: hypothetical protein H0T89_28510 [Deltaproteobacteria bacterium]|nr:hypothetical protein [Deltaproteobacteria bacterium]MDQ3296748.1 hypothetical protein [Myxococcota bacterium]